MLIAKCFIEHFHYAHRTFLQIKKITCIPPLLKKILVASFLSMAMVKVWNSESC